MDKALAIQREVQKILGTEEVYLVGGSVRDLVMDNEPKDYDMCGPLRPEQVEELCRLAGRRYYGVGKHFGVSGFKVQTSRGFELVEYTTYRNEKYTAKSRKPDVVYVNSLNDELSRRDFTCNAIVIRPDGTFYDKYGGRLDIHAKQIKTVGMPKDRIQEDPLRMLRAARFAARYNFKIDPNFIGKARQLADRIYDVSVERWVQELDKLFTSTYSSTGTRALEDMNVLNRVFPEFYSESGSDFPHAQVDSKVYESADLAWRDIIATYSSSKKMNAYLAAGICARLKFSNDRTNIILYKKK